MLEGSLLGKQEQVVVLEWLIQTLHYTGNPGQSSVTAYRCHVDGGGGFIHDKDAALADESSGQTEELPLADAEVLTPLRYHGI